MSEKEELIWVDKDFAVEYNKLKEEGAQREIKLKALNEYMGNLEAKTQRDFKLTLEGIQEDAAVYTGLLLQVKQAFEKAKQEHYKTSYEIWEDIDKEIPSITEKTKKVIAVLEPLAKKVEQINNTVKEVRTWDVDRLLETIEKLNGLYGNNKEMVQFLLNNYKPKKLDK